MSDISALPNEPRPPVVAAISMVEPHEPLPAWLKWAALVLGLAVVGTGFTAWQAQQRVKALEQELIRRQSDSQTQATEARLLAKQAQEVSRDTAAKTALLDTRLEEVALQREQVEDLIKSLSQSRDENMVVDIEATIRVAIQQSALTGSAEPLMNALQSADERISRSKQPRLAPVRRALAKDIDKLRNTRIADLTNLTIRLDEAIRLVDEAPLLNQAPGGPKPANVSAPTSPVANSKSNKKPAAAVAVAASQAASTPKEQGWHERAVAWADRALQTVWNETKALVRVTRIARPEGMLASPEQSFFLRENIKLRLLNARLALLSRQTASAIADVKTAQAALERYFDTDSKKTQLLQTTLDEVSGQSPQTLIPRPDDSLAALAAISGHSR